MHAAILSTRYSEEFYAVFHALIDEGRDLNPSNVYSFARGSKSKRIRSFGKSVSSMYIRHAMTRFHTGYGITRGRFLDSAFSTFSVGLHRLQPIIDECNIRMAKFTSNASLDASSKGRTKTVVVNGQLLEYLRNEVIKHEQKRCKYSQTSLCRKTPFSMFYNRYFPEDSSGTTALGGHIDNARGPTQVVCLSCQPEDYQVLEIAGNQSWKPVTLKPGMVANISREVLHRVKTTKEMRQVLVIFW